MFFIDFAKAFDNSITTETKKIPVFTLKKTWFLNQVRIKCFYCVFKLYST